MWHMVTQCAQSEGLAGSSPASSLNTHQLDQRLRQGNTDLKQKKILTKINFIFIGQVKVKVGCMIPMFFLTVMSYQITVLK